MRLLLVGLVFLVMLAVQQLHASFPSDLGARAALVFGFLMLAGFLLGEVITRFSVPRITGYLLAGMLFGPWMLAVVDKPVVEHLSLVNDLALVLIAFTAGGELRLARLKERARGIVAIALSHTLVVFVATAGTLFALSPWIHIFAGLTTMQVLGATALLGVIATAKSPATSVAVIVETNARGPMTDAVLGVTVLKDILVLVLFSLVLSRVQPLFGGGQPGAVDGSPSLSWLAAEVVLSLGAGVLLGGGMIAYLRVINKQVVLFVLATAFVLISLTEAFHLDPLLVAVAAGFVVSNYSHQGGPFLSGLERTSGPVFLIFFCLAGAGLDLGVLAGLWWVALIYIGIRTGFTWVGTWLGATWTREPPAVRRLAWLGFIGQAGVSLGLAALLKSQLPQIGGPMADLVVGGIVVNQILGPILFRYGLVKAGEVELMV